MLTHTNPSSKTRLKVITSNSTVLPFTFCAVCKKKLAVYYIVSDNGVVGYHTTGKYLSPYVICGDDICYNMALLSEDFIWTGY